MASVDPLREEAEEQPELWEARPCCVVQLGGKDYSTCPYCHLLSRFTFSCHILKQQLCPSLQSRVNVSVAQSHCDCLSHISWSSTCFQTGKGGGAKGSCAIKEASISLQTCWVLAWSRRAAGHSAPKPDSVTCAQGVWSGWWSAGQSATRLHPPWLYRYPFSAGHWCLHSRASGGASGRDVQGYLGKSPGCPGWSQGLREERKVLNVWALLPRMRYHLLPSSVSSYLGVNLVMFSLCRFGYTCLFYI